MAKSSKPTSFQDAVAVLRDAGVFRTNDLFRDAHTAAVFAETDVMISASPVTGREVGEGDWMRLLGHLIAAAVERGLRPAELLAIGMATALQAAPKAE